MFQNYLKVAFRNLLQHKFYSLINIAGLAVGMTVCILLMLSVQDELSYDNFHPNLDNLFRVVQAENTVTPAALGPTLKRDYPEVINFARVLWREWKLEAEDKGVVEIGACADPSFLDMFGFQYIAGDPATALFGPKSVVITESLKRKLFGDQNAIGKSITLRSHHQSTITGVIADLPHNTFLPDMSWIIPFNNIQKWWGWDLEDWDSSNYRTFVTLHNGVRYREFGQRIAGIASIYDPGNTTMVHLQPVRKIHLYGLKGEGPIRYVYIFSAVALCILLIACVNFMNLATARSAKRAKEVGMRKVVGANRGNLIKQFLSESILLSIFAMLMAVALVELLLPVFNGLTQKHLSINYAGNWMYFVGLVGIALFTGLVSGSYPALFLSSFNPVNALKYSSSTTVSAATLRKILVVSQFSLSILLIAGTIVVHKQLNYMRNKDLGYDKDYLVCMTWRTDLIKNWQTIAQKLQENPRIKAITLTNTLLDESESSTDDWTWQGKSDESKPKIRMLATDRNFLNVFGIDMVEGSYFSQEVSSDKTEDLIVNETAVKTMGMESPMGKWITVGDRTGEIIGVVKDFHFRSLHHKIQPLALMILPEWLDNISIKIASHDMPATIAFIEEKLKELAPGYPFDYRFLDDEINRRYWAEQTMGTMANYATFITIFISCLGLLGLASYVAERRTKEVGIRKVLGATMSGIVGLLSREFVILVAIAAMVASPAGYFVMDKWLQHFAYHIDIGIWTFLLAAGIALIITIVTVSYQAIRAALANPVDALRYE